MLAWMLLSTLAGPAAAEDAPPPPPPPSAPTGQAEKDTPPRTVGLRYRYTWLPQAVLDPWYFREEQSGHPRPTAHAHLIGLEYTVDRSPGIFTAWVEYWAVNMDEGYWDDKEQPPVHTDGDWLRPVGLGMIAAGGTFGHAIDLTPRDKDVRLDLGLMGGFGLGLPIGYFEQWYPGAATDPLTECHPQAMSTVRYQECPPDREVKPPPVLPILDLTLALRFHIKERAVLRLEGGLHNLPYVGVAGGGTF